MTIFVLAWLAGMLTIATPCIFPILPFVLARADTPFRRGGLPMLIGLAVAFAAVASLASVAGGWAVEANRHGRTVALILMTLFGLAMLLPGLAARLAAPIVSLGSRLSGWAERRTTVAASLLLGIATGLLWAPCAGPVLGLILTGAALRGPGVETSLLLFTYALGAATSLGIGMVFGRRLLAAAKQSVRWGEGVRRLLGAAVVAGAAIIWLGLDTGPLTRWSSAGTASVELSLIAGLRDGPNLGSPAYAETGDGTPIMALTGATQWLNTAPLKPADLRGKVVLVNFWTYSCINCLRILPHVRTWAAKYKDRGLVVIGVHTPEFAFEKNVAKVRTATVQLGVPYPVALDSDFRIWRAFDNRAWPALYFIDAGGRVRHQVLGEGEYEESERLIQALLAEAGRPAHAAIAPINGTGAQADPDGANLRSPETYIGYAQANAFASAADLRRGVPTLYRRPPELALNSWSLTGRWTIGPEFGTLADGPGRITHRFHARDLHLVMAPSSPDRPLRFRVTIDGAAPGASHGADIDAQGWGTLREDRLYQLVRQAGPVEDRIFEIEFFGIGARAYAFTFG